MDSRCRGRRTCAGDLAPSRGNVSPSTSHLSCPEKNGPLPPLNLNFLSPDQVSPLQLAWSEKCSTVPTPQSSGKPSSTSPSWNVRQCALTMPVYVYDCPLALLVDTLVYKEVAKMACVNLYDDHTYKTEADPVTEVHVETEADQDSQKQPSPDEPKSDSSDNASLEPTLREQCRLISLIFCKCFVLSLFKALHQGEMIAAPDVQSAVDECEETLIEIDITRFIQTVCGHMRDYHIKRKLEELKCGEDTPRSDRPRFPLSLLTMHSPCRDLKQLHAQIKDKFTNILTKEFRPVPTHPEFFFCSPTFEKKHASPSQGDESVQSSCQEELRVSDLEDIEFLLEPGSVPTTETVRAATLIGSLCSETSWMSDVNEGIDLTTQQAWQTLLGHVCPLFLHLTCSVRSEGKIGSCSVRNVPTCLAELRPALDTTQLDLKQLQVTLDVLCLTLPPDVVTDGGLDTTSDAAKAVDPKPRTTSFSSASAWPTDNQSPNSTAASVGSPADHEFCEEGVSDRLQHLPDRQHRAVTSAITEIEWLLRDEIAAMLLNEFPLSELTLHSVAEHVEASTNRATCLLEKVPLLFVFGPEQSLDRFLVEFHNLTVDSYRMRREGSYYHLAMDRACSKKSACCLIPPLSCITDRHPRHKEQFNEELLDLAQMIAESDSDGDLEHQGEREMNESKDSAAVSEEIGYSVSEDSSRIGNEDGYEGDSSDSDEDNEWLADLETRRPILPNFWLIMKVEPDCVTSYFHYRALEGEVREPLYRNVQRNCVASINEIVKLVNQTLLLASLYSTRMCDQLLESEASEDIWKPPPLVRVRSNDDGADDMSNPRYLEATMKFMPGWFACNTVWETHLVLHPRLKSGPGFSRGVQALRGVLNRFSVNNRANMFVYQDNSGNVFYLRLHENVRKNMSNRSDNEDHSPATVSRSSSIASLNARRMNTPDDTTSLGDLRPRLRSFGERDSPVLRPVEETVILKVHGISPAGPEVKEELVQVLQNRLDDAVLEVLVVMLARNPMCKLTPDDVQFIQKPGRSPENVIRFSVQPHAIPHLQALAFYLRQNLLQFMHTPKYLDARVEYHFQDNSELESSGKRVPEEDMFLYNQSPSSGSKGIACIALAVVTPSGFLVMHTGYPKPDADAYLRAVAKADFVSLTCTRVYDEKCLDEGPIIEFRIWKQGRVNVDALRQKLNSAVCHALWDLVMEYHLLTAPLPDTHVTPTKRPRRKANDENTANLCLGEVYHDVMHHWLEFAADMGVPAVKKHYVMLPRRHSLAPMVKEVQNLVTLNASDTNIWVFCATKQGYLPWSPTDTFPHSEDQVACLLIGRNLRQWQACITDRDCYDPDLLHPKAQKGLQKFAPLLETDMDGRISRFVPRQRLMMAVLTSQQVTIYTYNWSKDRLENLNKQVLALGNWLGMRAQVLANIVTQKMGLFHTKRENSGLQNENPPAVSSSDIEQLLKFTPNSHKERKSIRGYIDVFRDCKPSHNVSSAQTLQDPVVFHSLQMIDLQSNIVTRDNRKKLYVMWQTRGATPNIPLAEDMIVLFKQHSRIIHYCLTPLLFLPRWRLRSAATRDYTLDCQPPLTHVVSPWDQWHQQLCNNVISEYKQYLQNLGFITIQAEPASPKVTVDKDIEARVLDTSVVGRSVYYLQKSLLGGILLFELVMSEPFFHTKLHALECSRLQSKTSNALLMSQFTMSFVDECDRMKVLLHIHSFTYDYHLRSVQAYLSGQSTAILRQGFHLTHFLEDFLKYYNKAPNFARNLLHANVVSVTDVATESRQLYNYLLSHEKTYNMEVFRMMPATSDTAADNEYVMVQLSQTPHVSYRDAQDVKQTDDFDITLIVWDDGTMSECSRTLHLSYYIILTSRRELYPKHEIERKLGKFCTVSTANEEEAEPPASTSVEIRRESVNYLGYYSSHEQLMQRIMSEQDLMARNRIQAMVTQGSVDCRTHLLWNKLQCGGMSFAEFTELRRLSTCEPLSSLDKHMAPLLCQPVSWYLALVKVLQNRYPDHHRLMISLDGNETFLIVVHPRYLDAFMLLSVQLQSSRGDLCVIYRKTLGGEERTKEQREFSQLDIQNLIEGFVNTCCFHLWVGLT